MWQKVGDHCHRANSAPLKGNYMNKSTNSENQHESTYALLIRSEEKSRNLFEIAVYPLLSIGATIAIWQFVLQAVELPVRDAKAGTRVTSASVVHLRAEDRHPEIETRSGANSRLAGI